MPAQLVGSLMASVWIDDVVRLAAQVAAGQLTADEAVLRIDRLAEADADYHDVDMEPRPWE